MNTLDKVIGFISPQAGIKRAHARKFYSNIANIDNGYRVPGSSRKAMKGSTVRLQSPAQDIDRKFEGMKAISRDLSQNDAIATSIFDRYQTNVISFGLRVQPRIDAKFLGLSDTQREDATAAIIREFDFWSNSLEADFEGVCTPNEQQGLLYVNSLINGDMFYTLPWREPREADFPYWTNLRVVDSDLVRTPDVEWSGISNSTRAKIRNGIEFDETGRFVAVWVANFYKSDSLDYSGREYTRVPVYNENKTRQIFQLFDPKRVQQRRGIPLLAPVVENLKQISRYSESELMSQLVSSFFSVFIRDQSGMQGNVQQGYTPEESVTGGGGYGPFVEQEDKDSGDEFDLEMGHGNINYLDDDKDVTIAETRNKRDFEPFFKALAVPAAAATGLPVEAVFLEFQKSYSAMKGALNEAWKKYKSERVRFVVRGPHQWYRAVFTEAVLRDRIKAPGFFDDPIKREAWLRAAWIGAGQGTVEPYKEERASTLRVKNGTSTREEEYSARTGERWHPMIDRLSAENELMKEKGLVTKPEDESDVSANI